MKLVFNYCKLIYTHLGKWVCTTYASLHTFGKVQFAKDLFINVGRGIKIEFLIILKLPVGMPLGPVLLLFFR